MDISLLVNRLEHYAKTLKYIKHDSVNRRNRAFMHLDFEDIQQALAEGFKFPALFVQTPEVIKQGTIDNINEVIDFTYVVLLQKKTTKAALTKEAKVITDAIYNRMLEDFNQGIIPGMISQTTELFFGPISDGLYGWAVSVTINDAYDAILNQNDWTETL